MNTFENEMNVVPDCWDDESTVEPIIEAIPSSEIVARWHMLANKIKEVEANESDSESSDDEITISFAVKSPPSVRSLEEKLKSLTSKVISLDEGFPSLQDAAKMPKKKVDQVVDVVESERTKAFNLLADAKKVVEAVKCTRMCSSVANGTKCPHGDNCRFAHSKEQLVIRQCFFNKACNFVVNKGGGVYENVRGVRRPCEHSHPGESRENYFSRLRLPMAKVVGPKQIAKTTIKVSKDMADQAIKMALDSGKDVRVEIF